MIKQVIINKWDGGVVNDPNDTSSNVCRTSTYFDIFSDQGILRPYQSSESGDDAASTSQKQNFCIGYWTAGTPAWKLFALGRQAAAEKPEILSKDLTTSNTDLSDNLWATPLANQSANTSTNYNLFLYYKKTGKIYGSRSSRYIWEFTPDGSTPWSESKYDYGSTFTNISQGLVHSKDDIMYFGIDNKIIKNDNGTFAVALTLPTHLYITSVCEYGNYLAIGCAPVSGIGSSIVYLWDRDSTLTTLSESIDWGEGNLKVLEEIDGYLIGISLLGATTTKLNDSVVFKYYAGGRAVKFKEIFGDISYLPIAKQKANNRLYFMLSITLNGVVTEGVWSVGRSSPNSSFGLALERTPNNDTALTSGILKNFFLVGDFMFISYVDNGTFGLSKTTESSTTYSATSIRETVINPKMDIEDRFKNKQLTLVVLTYDALPTAGQVVLKYRVDGGSWTTIFTDSTDSSFITEKRNEEGGTNFKSGRNYEFRIESTGGAVVNSLFYEYEILKTLI